MPIHPSVLRARPAECGKIKIGRLSENKKQAQGGREYRTPERLNHFIITKTVRKGQDENFVEDTELMLKLAKDGDEKIRTIPIVLDSDIIDEVFPTTLACYAGRALHCRGTGEGTATRFEIVGGRQSGKTKAVPCTCSYLTEPKKLVCKPHGTLWCTIYAGDVTRIGVRHSFRTTSWHSISAIVSGLERIRTVFGTICGIPLLLVINPTLVRTKEGGTRTIQVVHIELATKDMMGLQRHSIESARVRHDVAILAGKPLVLGAPRPAGDQEMAAEQRAVQEEWHPEEQSEDGPEDGPDDEGEEGDLEPGKDFDANTGEVFDVPFTERATGEHSAVGDTTTPKSASVPASELKKDSSGYTAAPKSEPKPGTERMNPPGTTSPVAGGSAPQQTELARTTATATVGFDDVLPVDDPARVKLGALLRELAQLRAGDDKVTDKQLQATMKEILADFTSEWCGGKVKFADLKLGHAMKILPRLDMAIDVLKPRPESSPDASDEQEPEDEDIPA